MNPYALATLEMVLAIARRNGADEVRLISGSYPRMIVGNNIQLIDGPELSTSMIRAIHQGCLSLSGSATPKFQATSVYRFVSATLGPVNCKFSLRGDVDVALLSLFPEDNEFELVQVKGPVNPPTLRAEASIDKVSRVDGEGGPP